MATAQERSEELLSVGHQCSHSTCNLVDFLPFKCQHCEQQFCGEHFLPQAHKCEEYDQSKYDRVAPSCPLCNEPVSIPPGQDPNLGMERHFSTECSVMTGKIKKSSVPRCAKAKCGKLLFSPIQCAGCKQQYCPSHRFPKDHTCASLTNANTTGSGSRPKQSAAAGAAALAALKRAVPSAKPPSATESRTTAPAASSAKPKLTAPALKIPTPSTSSSSSNNKTNTHNPFSKTDRSLSSPSTSITLSLPMVPPDAANTNDPPERCTPKSPSTAGRLPFVPPPVFGYA